MVREARFLGNEAGAYASSRGRVRPEDFDAGWPSQKPRTERKRRGRSRLNERKEDRPRNTGK